MIERNRQSGFKRDAFSQTCEQAREGQSVFARPIDDTLRFSESGEQSRRPPIARLLKCVAPFAVLWFVAEVVIQPVDRVVQGWSRSHVGVEVSERILPTLTDRDASCAVILEGWRTLVVATILHAVPDAVFTAPSHVVRRDQRSQLFSRAASAGLTSASRQLASCDDAFRAAIATATPRRTAVGSSAAWNFLNSHPTTDPHLRPDCHGLSVADAGQFAKETAWL